MKKKIIFMSCIIVLFLVIFHIYNKNFNNDNVIRNQKQISQNNKMLSIMLETDIGSDEYEISDETSWPVHTHKLNENLSYCENGGTFYYNPDTYQIEFNTDISDRCFLYFDKKPPIASETILKNSNLNESYQTFSGPATTNEGILKTSDEMYWGESYYFRGDVNDNYVKFGDYYWRIIRINGDNSIRIIYDGTNLYPNGDGTHGEDRQISKMSFNSNESGDANVFYNVGFRYESQNGHGIYSPSLILGNDQGTDEGSLNWWYKQNIVNKGLEKFVDQNGLFCNDRSVTDISGTSWGLFIGMGFDDATNPTSSTMFYMYGAKMRFNYNENWIVDRPTLDCYREYDIFSKKNSLRGNKSLQYPIGLITADEIVFAGGYGNQENKKYYLYTGEDYWTMSPSHSIIDMLSYSFVYAIVDSKLMYSDLSTKIGVRPVLNLKADVSFEGSGTIEDPYTIFD